MKRSFSLITMVVFTILIFSVTAFAGPRVAIVKTDNHEVVGEGYTYDPNYIQPYDFDKPIKKIMTIHVTWTPESQAAIEKLVRKAIELTGEDWPVKKGNTVFIKPNLVVDINSRSAAKKTKPEELQSVTTDPRVVRAIALVALESGASKVMFGDLPALGDSYATAMAWGYKVVEDELAAKYPGKVELVDLKAVPFKYYKPSTGGLALKEYAIAELLVNTDIMISAPVMKTHIMAGVTLALKNIGIGANSPTVYGQSKMGLPHQRLAEVITDVCSIVKIDYVVVDAIWAMEGAGPVDGKPIAMDMVIAGKDPVAVDWVTTEVMGFKGDMFGTTRLGQKHGLGTYENVEIVGLPILQAMKQFEVVPRASRFPGVYSHNVGWGSDAAK